MQTLETLKEDQVRLGKFSGYEVQVDSVCSYSIGVNIRQQVAPLFHLPGRHGVFCTSPVSQETPYIAVKKVVV